MNASKLLLAASLGWPGAALAQSNPAQEFFASRGTAMSVGAGVVGFSDETMRDFTEVGAAWDARMIVGTKRPIALEAAYTGGAQAVDALGLDKDALLVSHGLEADVRAHVPTGALALAVKPYFLLGAGWRRYNIQNADNNTSSVNDRDDVFEIPVGIGLDYQIGKVLIDARGLFRTALNSDLVAVPEGGGETALHTWTAALTAGMEF